MALLYLVAQQVGPRAWVLWVGGSRGGTVVGWINAVEAFHWSWDCERRAQAFRSANERSEWRYECFPSETHPAGGR
jgi:hypothetical protein